MKKDLIIIAIIIALAIGYLASQYLNEPCKQKLNALFEIDSINITFPDGEKLPLGEVNKKYLEIKGL